MYVGWASDGRMSLAGLPTVIRMTGILNRNNVLSVFSMIRVGLCCLKVKCYKWDIILERCFNAKIKHHVSVIGLVFIIFNVTGHSIMCSITSHVIIHALIHI